MKKWKWVVIILLFLAGLGAAFAYSIYQRYQEPITSLGDAEGYYLFIPTGSSYEDVVSLLEEEELIRDMEFFKLLAERKNYPRKVKPGRYLLTGDMNANELVNMLRSGLQEPIQLTFNNLRFARELAPLAARKLEADSAGLTRMMSDPKVMEGYGFDRQNFMGMFLPDTYEFFWNTSEREFLDRMKKEYDRFWTKDRMAKAKALGLKRQEVSVLASIVQSETIKRDEMARVAGLYINRLKRGMLLQADPTVKFAVGDFSLTRILYSHLEYDSPYNTYKYAGLPPGPICMPDKLTIDHVLNYEEHAYIYMCAKADGSGYHAFARSLREHNRNAAAYHRYYKEWRRKNRK